ncbi:Uncharacterized protein DAT39_014899 [Clarias magur]|uniref:Uncharacterized protein n=1 Tax=Clarias magur TaxID=1594786 RepID=A0A8J4X6N2_CLAMG|nr:Uncharacterized protein DAT39_014899 [Clarias magur]
MMEAELAAPHALRPARSPPVGAAPPRDVGAPRRCSLWKAIGAARLLGEARKHCGSTKRSDGRKRYRVAALRGGFVFLGVRGSQRICPQAPRVRPVGWDTDTVHVRPTPGGAANRRTLR